MFQRFVKKFPSKHCDIQYAKLVHRVVTKGEYKDTRNGETLSKFAVHMHFDLKNDTVPVITTKKLAWKTCFKELLWFISGNTDNSVLQKQNVKIWNQNAAKEFLRSRQLNYENDGDLGPIYGHQWRHFNAPYIDCKTDYSNKGIDQLQNIINALRCEDKYSRRLVMSAWNPCQLDEMALPPCHIISQFSVNSRDELSCILYQRSGDIGLGVPFNMASYGFLTCLLARHTGLKPGGFSHFIGDAHIYKDHIPYLMEQIELEPYISPQLHINNIKESIDEYDINDFDLLNYNYHPSIKMAMIA